MKIKRLKLVNFIGIKRGLDLDEIEIDFSKGKNKIVALFGGNGSGKSTIMSQLHPYKESFDDKKNCILDGEVGRKEIDIESDGHLYEIVHTYCKSAQSFIKKDGKELNENGGVKTFEKIVEKELGITKDFQNIGKLGSNSKNFVNMTAMARKNYIGTFLNIDDITDAYSIANDKLKTLNKSITSVANSLKNFKTKEVIETEISELEKSASEIEEELSKLYIKQGSLNSEKEHTEKDISNLQSVEVLKNKINEKTNDIKTTENIINNLKDDITEADTKAYKTKLLEDISTLQGEIQVNNSEKQNKNLLITDYKNKISKYEIEMSSLGNPEDIKKLEDEIVEYEQKSNEIKERIKNNKHAFLVKDMKAAGKQIEKLLNKFTEFSNFIEKYFNELGKTSITNTTSNIKFFFQDDFEESFKRQVTESKKVIEAKNSLLERQQKERGISESYVCQLENLEKRPKECKIDDCPFIKAAYEHRNILSEIVEKDKEIFQTKKDIESLTIKSENLQNLQNLYINFTNAYSNVMPRENDIYKEFIKDKSLIEWVEGSLADFQVKRQKLIDDISSAYEDMINFANILRQLNNAKSGLKTLKDSDSTVREKYENDLKEAKEKLEKLNEEYLILEESGKEVNSKLEARQNLLKKYSDFIDATSKHDSAQVMLSTANVDYKKALELEETQIKVLKELEEVKTSIQTLMNSKAEKSHNLTLLKANLARVEELNAELEKLNTEYKPVETVCNALGPNGIQSVLRQVYLNETEAIANELLDIAFNGDFQIKFVQNESEFRIEVFLKGHSTPDIKDASQGEIAITTISLSLALIEQSIGAYNILCLDEIDGPLDVRNRSNFINILNKQIEKLNMEQMFVISHNDAFDTADMDMILLKGNSINQENESFMKNKTIVYEYKGI